MKNLYKSLAAFQQECPVIHKGTPGYGYSYADLPAIFEIITPILAKNGLGISQPIIGTEIETILFHSESGENITARMQLPQDVELKGMNDFQVLGSAITYCRRYALSSMLGLVTDKDLDAAGEQVAKPVAKPSTKAPVVGNPNYDDVPFPSEEIGVNDFTQAFGGKVVASSQIASKSMKPGKESYIICKKCGVTPHDAKYPNCYNCNPKK